MTKLYTTLLSLIFTISTYGQSNSEIARQQLHEMKNGVLLVRLFTKEDQIAALKEHGQLKQAERVSQQQHAENKDIILSFSQVFEFCPVYFFYSRDSESIRNKDFEDKIFDSGLQKVNPSEIKGTVFTAEFSETPNMSIPGLIIMNDQLFPLEAPFPFYQRKHTLLGIITLTKSKMVHRLNNKLRDTYDLWFPTNP